MIYVFTCKCGKVAELDVDVVERVPFTDARIERALSTLGWRSTKPAGMYVCFYCPPSFSPAPPLVASFAR